MTPAAFQLDTLGPAVALYDNSWTALDLAPADRIAAPPTARVALYDAPMAPPVDGAAVGVVAAPSVRTVGLPTRVPLTGRPAPTKALPATMTRPAGAPALLPASTFAPTSSAYTAMEPGTAPTAPEAESGTSPVLLLAGAAALAWFLFFRG